MSTTKHWVLRTLLLAGVGLAAAPSHAQQVNVGISGTGAVRFTDASGLACDATTEGSIRYEDASNRVEFCDDSVWTVLGPGGVGTIYITDLADAVTDYVTDHNMRIGSNTPMFAGAANNVFIGDSAGSAGTSAAADNNVAIGYTALDALTTGAGNVAIGREALTRSTSGVDNIAIGNKALENNTIGGGNVAIGTNALGTNSDGGGSIGIGYGALSALTADGYWNTALGYQAGDGITTGDSNIVIGYNVDPPSNTANSQLTIGNLIFATGGFGTGTTVGTGNVGIGIPAPGVRLSVGNGATSAGVIGIYEDTDNGANYASFTVPALAANTVYTLPADDGDAGEQLQTDGSGTLTWESAGGGGSIDSLSDATYDTGADHNMRLGSNTAMTAGAANNLFIGESAGTAGTTNAADGNIAVGYQALDALTTGASNVAIGVGALSANTTPSGQVAIGFEALMTANTGAENTAIGYQALRTVTASQNVAVGHGALDQAGNAERNVAVGMNALTNNSTGGYNVAIGSNALLSNDDGGGNVAVGQAALYYNTSGAYNVAIGRDALGGNNPSGSGSTAVGYNALLGMATGGTQNIALGYAAGDNVTTGDLNVIIGYDVDAMSATGNSQLNIGDTIYGDLANDRIRIGGSGTVAVGPLYAVPPATETIAGAGTITANACGTIKRIQSTGSVTTSTANTFTGSTAAGCCMDVINVDAADTVTLDANGAFKTIGAADQALGPSDTVRVCSDGTNWYQMGAVSANN